VILKRSCNVKGGSRKEDEDCEKRSFTGLKVKKRWDVGNEQHERVKRVQARNGEEKEQPGWRSCDNNKFRTEASGFPVEKAAKAANQKSTAQPRTVAKSRLDLQRKCFTKAERHQPSFGERVPFETGCGECVFRFL
jgi:hypothetical protein